MGADKNSSLWLNSAYTLIATPRTHKHKQDPKQGSNNLKVTTKKPRNKSQTNPTRKHNSKSKGLRQSGKHQADRPQCPGGLSTRRALQYCTEKNGPSASHGPSDTLVRTVRKLHAPKTHRQNESKERQSRARKNTKNSWAVRNLADGPR
jgi:hypothetical protein